jgi:hypothetical protein
VADEAVLNKVHEKTFEIQKNPPVEIKKEKHRRQFATFCLW